MIESKNLNNAKYFFLITSLLLIITAYGFSSKITVDAANTGSATQRAAAYQKERLRRARVSRWYAVCTNVGRIMAKKNFRYSNGGVSKSFRTALKKGKKRCNCARYVSWCLQEYGAISRKKTFYANEGGGINKSFKSWGKKVSVHRVYRSPARAGLKEGDICFWDGVPHVCIYAGRSASGRTLWFDGGKVATRSNSEGSTYSKYGRRHLGYLDGRTISYIVRIRDLQ